MELAQCRLVTDDVEGLAGFYARLLGGPAALNQYYVELQAGPASIGFSRRRFTEHREDNGPLPSGPGRRDDIILDFLVDDMDAEYPRIAALGVDWVMPPATQPWGNRSMMFRDPAGHLVNVFSRGGVLTRIHDARGHDDDAGAGRPSRRGGPDRDVGGSTLLVRHATLPSRHAHASLRRQRYGTVTVRPRPQYRAGGRAPRPVRNK
jgi:predicted enzyme related to lactoylglutathione lyase